MKDINIVLVNFLIKDDTLNAIASLVQDTASCPFSVQITVADNSRNQDGIKDALAENFPLVKYVDCGGNVGFGRGNNIGFQTTEARYYFALNSDVVIPDNSRTVERLIRFMDEHPKIGCAGPKLVNPDGTLQYTCFRFDLPSILIKPFKQINWDKKYSWIKKHADKLIMKDFNHHATMPVDWVLGAALIVRAEAVKQVGWFDERYFMYMEDCDWCHEFWARGWPVYYVHDIVIRHGLTRNSAKVPGVFRPLFKNRLARVHLISWLKYLWKWRGQHKYYAELS
ncbi:MAG: glycosyltransferase family 2 protein [Patescibacteria group bacterium]|nr:glycosyltransferase family 2 protein [Patescibacteria group bacterium]